MNDMNHQGYEAPVQDPAQPQGDYNATQDANTGNNKLMAVISYLGLLFLIPLLTKAHESSPFVKLHLNQGLLITVLGVAVAIVSTLLGLIQVTRYTYVVAWLPPVPYSVTPWWITLITSLLSLAVVVLAIIGIINAAQGKMSKLPLIGDLFTFFK